MKAYYIRIWKEAVVNYQLTLWSRFLKRLYALLVKKFPAFMEPEGTLLCSSSVSILIHMCQVSITNTVS
jgi:hypothetical protein